MSMSTTVQLCPRHSTTSCNCRRGDDSTTIQEDEEEGISLLLSESVAVVAVGAKPTVTIATTSTTSSCTGESVLTHCNRRWWWRILLVGGILVFAIISPKYLNNHARDTSDHDAGVAVGNNNDIKPEGLLPAIVPRWQSIVPDTGCMYPLMGGDNHNHQWKLYSTDRAYSNISIKGEPGDIITDLMNAGIMEEPYLDLNFLKQRYIWTGGNNNTNNLNTSTTTFSNQQKPILEQRERIWVYETEFELPPEMQSHDHHTRNIVLVLEGIKMGARLEWNDIELGVVTDQFLRYTFTVPYDMLLLSSRRDDKHKLTITFDPTIGTDGRFAGYSGGWDWAAYMPVGDERGSRVWTFGIFKHMYIVAVENVYISHVVPKIYYQGKHPTRPMLDGPEADFEVQVDVHVVSPGQNYDDNSNGNESLLVEITSNFTSSESINKKLIPKIMKAEEEIIVSFNMTASKDEVELWWPNGMGEQQLYPLHVRLIRQHEQQGGGGGNGTATTSSSPAIQKWIGFRTSALVTIDDTKDDAEAKVENQDGSGNHGMYFRVNGAMIWARGGNVIPMDQLEGRLSEEAHRELVRSTAAAHMNMLRVWGGGMVLPDSFYDACDEEGILLYHDMLFVQEHNHGALYHPTVTTELKHTIRSLANHPSIVVWNGCNECDDLDIFASYVMRIVADEDDTRAIWPNSPSRSGWAAGVNQLDGRPNGKKLMIGQQAATKMSLEGHGPYAHSYSSTHPTVNSVFA